MKEELIGFDTAVLAKEKGFNEKCRNHYNTEGKLSGFTGHDVMKEFNINSKVELIDTNTEEFEYPKVECTCPTQSLLQRWLREKHNIVITVASIFKHTPEKEIKYWFWIQGCEDDSEEEIFFATYEEALEVALQEGFKLIKE